MGGDRGSGDDRILELVDDAFRLIEHEKCALCCLSRNKTNEMLRIIIVYEIFVFMTTLTKVLDETVFILLYNKIDKLCQKIILTTYG